MRCTAEHHRWIYGIQLAACLLVVLVVFEGGNVNAQTLQLEKNDPLMVQQTDASQASHDEAEAVARQQLDQILSDPMFHRWELARDGRNEIEGAWLSTLMETADRWREKMIAWFRDLFARDIEPSHPSEGMWPSAGVVFKVLAYVLGALLVVFVMMVIVRILRAPAQPASTRILSRKRLQEALQQGHALATDSSQWMTEAIRLAQNNDLRLAYRAMYLALLSGLHQQRTIDFHQQRTNWTYVEQYRGEAAGKKSLAGLTEMFDAVWYGLGQPEAQKLDEVRLQIDSLLSPTASREGKP